MTMIDAVVIGAGAAGLAAAKTLVEQGFAVQVIEARNRIGGRAHTDLATYGVPHDLGCAWLHSADINPFYKIAGALGFTVLRQDAAWRGRIGVGLTAQQRAAIDRTIEEGFDAIHAAGEAGRDVAASEVLPPEAPGRPVLDAICSWAFGVDTPEVSTLDHFLYRDTGRNWPVVEGYGALVSAYGAGLPVKLSTPASEIDWRGPGVRVETPAGVLRARIAIVTIPTGVLAEGRLRFRPALPAEKLRAIENLPLGIADKVSFAIAGDPFGTPPDSFAIAHADTARTCSIQFRPFGRDLVICYFGGRYARELEERESLIAAGEEALTHLFGSAVRKQLRKPTATAWYLDPYARGAYSAARPGHAHRRKELAAPIEERLFFAGEACSLDSFSTCHGAHLSGTAAALAAARVLTSPRSGKARRAKLA
jgi:monoamine oxidase